MPIPTSSTGQSYPPILDYRIVQLIGGGGFSKVFRAVNSKSKTHPVAAIKVISYAPGRSNKFPIDRRALQKEVQVHSILKHPNVLEFLGAVERGLAKAGLGAEQKGILVEGAIATTQESRDARERESQRQLSGQDREENYVPGLYLVLELGAGGDLFDKIAPDYGLDEDLAHFYFTQLVAGLEYIHSQGVAHRDIKPENMLLDAEGNLKIADFGLCSVYKYKGKEREMNGACGSLPYIAPEMNGRPYRGEPVDVWSSGVVLFAMLVGSTPWDEPTSRSPEYQLYRTGELFRYEPWTHIPLDALSLLKKMMHPVPDRRISIEGIKRHRWYQRENPFISQKGRCNDPVNLAEKLLQGLAVSGDIRMDVRTNELHTDGKRAEVPANVSLSQPENLQTSSFGAGGGHMLPPSTALPALEAGADADAGRRLAMSQHINHRRQEMSQNGGGPEASQFTQALNHFTQFEALTMGQGHARFSAHLTRFFASAAASLLTKLIAEALEFIGVQICVEAMGDSSEVDEAYAFMVGEDERQDESQAREQGQGQGQGQEEGAKRVQVGSRGSRIRLGTMDKRKCPLRGEVRVEVLDHQPAGNAQCLVVFRRSKGNPLEWRRLFREICNVAEIRAVIIST